MKEFVTDMQDIVEPEESGYVSFMLDGREMKSYKPGEGQVMFLTASLGRGSDPSGRFPAIINLLSETLDDEDKAYFNARLLSRTDPLPPKVLEDIFSYLVEEWFARPTKSPSDSATSPQSDGPN